MASSTSASSQSKLLGLAAVVFTLLVTVQGQQPNNAGGGPQNAWTHGRRSESPVSSTPGTAESTPTATGSRVPQACSDAQGGTRRNGGTPGPRRTQGRGKPRSGLDRGRPIDVPTGMPQFPHPQGIPTRQGGSGNAMHSGEK
ncbi:hypothetical protein MTO96_026255 [Rhipicephalus appendiculatus]